MDSLPLQKQNYIVDLNRWRFYVRGKQVGNIYSFNNFFKLNGVNMVPSNSRKYIISNLAVSENWNKLLSLKSLSSKWLSVFHIWKSYISLSSRRQFLQIQSQLICLSIASFSCLIYWYFSSKILRTGCQINKSLTDIYR